VPSWKKYKSAIEFFKQALAMDESLAATHVNLAEAWIGLGRWIAAMTEYARALNLTPNLSDRIMELSPRSAPEQTAPAFRS